VHRARDVGGVEAGDEVTAVDDDPVGGEPDDLGAAAQLRRRGDLARRHRAQAAVGGDPAHERRAMDDRGRHAVVDGRRRLGPPRQRAARGRGDHDRGDELADHGATSGTLRASRSPAATP
jgi:hypothetical protein